MFERVASQLVAASRSLLRMPFLVGGALVTIAIAVGLNIAILGLMHRALLSAPGGVAEPERVFTLSFGSPEDREAGAARPLMSSTSYVAFKTIRESVRAATQAAAFQRAPATMMLEGEQRSVTSLLVSGSYFGLLASRAQQGRVLGPGDDDAGAPLPGAVISHAFWRSALNEDSAALNRRVHIGGVEYEIVGIMPEGFSGHTTARVDVFVPFAAALRDTPGWDRQPFRNVAGVVVRLAPGETTAAATTQASAALDRPVALRPLSGADVGATERSVALWLGGVALLVLVIGLANSAVLLVVRAVRSRQAMAIRSALGASGRQLRTHAMREAGLLAVVATLAALMLASWMDDALRQVLFPDLSRRGGTGFAPLLVAGLAGFAAAAVAFVASASQLPSGSSPAPMASMPATHQRRTRTLTSLLVLQTALAVLLLGGAGLFASSLYQLRAQDFGLAFDSAMVVDFAQTSTDLDGQDRFFTEALERVAGLPEVELATTIDSIPFAGFNVPPIAVPGRAEPPSVGRQLPFLTAATPEFLRILDIKVMEGRGFTAADDRGAPVVLVNQTMARSVWPGESAVGKCIRIGFDPDFDPASFDPSSGPPMPSDAVPCREIVGVTRDVRQRSVLPFDGEDRLMQYFVPFSQVPTPPFAPPNPTRIRGLLIKTNQNGDTLAAAAIRRAAVGGRVDLPYLRVRPYAELLARQLRPWDMGTRLLGLLSALAISVAAIGMFAAFAHAVAERRREMAIRLAIGARPSQVRGMVVREALKVALAGITMGGTAAILAGYGMRSLLFGTAPADPLVLATASLMMLSMAALATILPAREASKADPSVLLRAE